MPSFMRSQLLLPDPKVRVVVTSLSGTMNMLWSAWKLWLEELEKELLELEKDDDEELQEEELENEELDDENEDDEQELELENEELEHELELENDELELEQELELEKEDEELEKELEQEENELEQELEDELEQTKNSILVSWPDGASKSCRRNRSRLFDQSMFAGGLVPPGLGGIAILAMILLPVSLSLKSQSPEPRL